MLNRWIGLAAVFFLATGCGGDGERLEPAVFDLTGDWRYRDVECTSVSDDLPQAALAELDGDLAYEASQHPGFVSPTWAVTWLLRIWTMAGSTKRRSQAIRSSMWYPSGDG